jgi:hypothetical protein
MAASLSQSLATFAIPAVDHDDPEPVRSSLAQAHADFTRGEHREALRHLRRAAEGADEAGSELRAVALARAAADLATEVGGSFAPPPVKEKDSPIIASAASSPTPSPSAAPVSLVRGTDEAALKQLLDSGRAVKVVVKRSARDEGLSVVRRAEAGGPGLGAREAIVVLLEPDDGFWDPGKRPE